MTNPLRVPMVGLLSSKFQVKRHQLCHHPRACQGGRGETQSVITYMIFYDLLVPTGVGPEPSRTELFTFVDFHL